MKRVFLEVASLMIVSLLLLSGCNTAQTTPTQAQGNPAATSTSAIDPQALSATETAFASRIRPARTQAPATPTADAAGPATATPAAGTPAPGATATATPAGGAATVKTPVTGATTAAPQATLQPSATATTAVVQPTTISTLGAIPVPEKRTPLNFAANGSVSAAADFLNDGVPVAYQFTASPNQLVYLAVYGRTNIQVYDPKLAPVTNNLMMPGYISLAVADSGVYTVVMSGIGSVTLSVYLPPAGSNLAGAAPIPAQAQAVKLPVQPLSVSFYNKLVATEPAAYTFSAQAGQTLSLQIAGSLTATLIMPDGSTAAADIDTVSKLWVFKLPETGSYTLVFLGVDVINVTAKITPPLTGTPLAAPQVGGNSPILIAPDSSEISFSTYLVADKTQTYVLHLAAKQVLYIDLTGNALITKIVGPGNTPIATNHADITTRWSSDIVQEGDYVITISGKGPSSLTFSLPTKGIN